MLGRWLDIFIPRKDPSTQKHALFILSLLGQRLDKRTKSSQVQVQLRRPLLPETLLGALTSRISSDACKKDADRNLSGDMSWLLVAQKCS